MILLSEERKVKVVIAIDSFKGSLTSVEANRAAAEGVRSVWPDAEIVQVPVSDGGEGFLEAFHAAIGGELQEVVVRDPLMRPITAKYLLCGEEAEIEIAQASGLTLLTPEERNPMVATSYGTGELVADAVRRGAKHIIVGLGGSATSDVGIGMLEALVESIPPAPSHRGGVRGWPEIKVIKKVTFTIATDVKNPLCGENGAAHVFGPQKCNPQLSDEKKRAIIRQLDERARKFAEVSAKHLGYDRSEMAGAGAAGGLGYAFLQYMDAECRSGIELVLDTIDFKTIVKDADLVITGEGSADRQTLMGKLPMGILKQSSGVHSLRRAQRKLGSAQVPVCLIAGRISDKEQLLHAGFAHVECINPPDIALEEAMRKEVAERNVRQTIRTIAQLLL